MAEGIFTTRTARDFQRLPLLPMTKEDRQFWQILKDRREQKNDRP